MKNLLNPRWLLVLNTLPIFVLFYIFYGEYSVIHTLLNETNIYHWKIFGFSLAGLTVINLAYALYLIARKKQVSGYYAVYALLAHIVWIYLFFMNLEHVLPINVPQWMFPGNIIIYTGTFLMPTLAYSLLVLATVLTRSPARQKAWINFLIMIIIPAIVYLLFVKVLPLIDYHTSFITTHGYLIFIILSTLLFLFFLVRVIIILMAKKAKAWKKYELVWKIPVAIILPVLGLLFNNGVFMSNNFSALFGDFSNAWFYVLASANGVLLCIPRLKGKTPRLILYLMRCVTFAYTSYFFIVFLPFLPLSIVAIIAYGLGFLMLAPLILFIVHAGLLTEDFRYLKRYHTRSWLLTPGIICFLAIPAIITVEFVKDRHTLHEALDYVYEPDYSKTYQIDQEKLFNTLDYVKENKRNRNVIFAPRYLPYISALYNRIVLDNMTLSDKKIETMKYLFSGINIYYTFSTDSDETPGDEDVRISRGDVATRFDESRGVWISEFDMEITNHSDSGNKEYATTFELPDGCWISDYYLYVGDRREPGVLSEKRSAMWVYSQIMDESKDPGILHYQTGNRIVFKVFPFLAGETRRTGIEFMHKEPFALTVDNFIYMMNDSTRSQDITEVIGAGNRVDYIPAQLKLTLPEAEREPYFHFILDNSDKAAGKKEKYIYYAEKLMTEHPLATENARFSICNTYVETISGSTEWKQKYWGTEYGGGLFLDRALKTALVQAFKAHRYPIIVVLTDDIRSGFLDQDFADYGFLLPESDFFYLMNDEGKLSAHSLIRDPYKTRIDSLDTFERPFPVVKYSDENDVVSYVRNNNAPTVLLKEPIFTITSDDMTQKSWENGLLLQGHWMSQILHPETSGKGWLKLAEASFKSGIMTPVTSYIVVENEAQRAALGRKQGQVMDAHKLLNIATDSRSMSEPGFFVMLVLLGVVYVIVHRKKCRIK